MAVVNQCAAQQLWALEARSKLGEIGAYAARAGGGSEGTVLSIRINFGSAPAQTIDMTPMECASESMIEG